MYPDIKTIASPELVDYYTRLNTEVNEKLISGSSWEAVKDDVNQLTEIAKELTIRKINFNTIPAPAKRQSTTETE